MLFDKILLLLNILSFLRIAIKDLLQTNGIDLQNMGIHLVGLEYMHKLNLNYSARFRRLLKKICHFFIKK